MNHSYSHVLITIILLFSVGMSACSKQTIPGSQLVREVLQKPRKVKLKKLSAIKPTINTKVVWQKSTESEMGFNKVHPYVDNSAVFVAGGNFASSWQKESGKLKWKIAIGEIISAGVNGTLLADPSSGGKARQILLGTANGNAISLDANTGKVQWIERLSSEVASVSPAYNNRVVFRTIDGKIHGLSANAGELIWQRTQKTPALSIMGSSVPVIVPPLIIAGFDNGKVAAYNLLTGQNAWEVTLAFPQGNTELERIIDIDGKIKPLGNALFAASLNGSTAGINMENGKSVWSNAFSSPSGVTANPQGLYSNDDKGNIWKFDPSNGSQVWTMDELQNRSPTVPVLVGNLLMVIADRQGNLHWINTAEGKFADRKKGDPAGYSVEPEVVGNSVYAIGKSGILSKMILQ